MKITHLERTVVSVPFLPGILPPADRELFTPAYPAPLGERRHDILRIHTDGGLTGIGMSPPYFGGRPDAPPDLIGKDPNDLQPRSLGGGGYDMALLDLIGKSIGWPLCRLFGGRLQERVAIDYWISRVGIEASAEAAARARALGFKGIKIKCRYEDGDVVDRALAMHEAAPELRIVLDPNERFHNLANALEIAAALEGLDIVLEDPFPKEDFSDHRRLKDATNAIVAPHLQNPGQVIRAIALEAVDAINIAPSDWGFLDMARIAESEGIPVWQASNVDLGLFDVFRLHASGAAPNCTLGSDMCGNFVHEHSLLAEPLVQDGHAVVPNRPGLGVELDEEAVRHYMVD